MTGPASKEPTSTPPDEKKEAPKKEEPIVSKRGFLTFVTDNKWDVVAYLLLFLGLILCFSVPFIGGLLVGLILGLYFSQEIVSRASGFKHFIDEEGIFRGFIVVAAVLALLIMAAGLVIGAIIGAWVRPFLGNAISSPFDKSDK